MERHSNHIFWGMTALAIALIISALIAANAARSIKLANDTITVTGSAKRPIRSDYAVWSGNISSQKPLQQDAYREIKKHSARLREYFREQGIPDSAINFDPISTRPVRETSDKRHETGRVVGYQSRQKLEIRSSDVDKIKNLSGEVTELILEGINFASNSPEYLITTLTELRSEMLAEASKDAHQRAVNMAHSVGSEIGALRNARMGVFQITARHSTEIRDYGRYDTRALEKDITAVVRLTFAIE